MKAKSALTVAMCISVTLLACGGAQTASAPQKPANVPPAGEATQGGETAAPADSPPANNNSDPNTTGAAPAR